MQQLQYLERLVGIVLHNMTDQSAIFSPPRLTLEQKNVLISFQKVIWSSHVINIPET